MSKNWRQDLRNKLYERDRRKCHYCGIEELDFTKLWGENLWWQEEGETRDRPQGQ